MTHHQKIEQAVPAHLDWTRDPATQALVEVVRKNPPEQVIVRTPSISALFEKDEHREYVGPVVSALRAIANEYFRRVEDELPWKEARAINLAATSEQDLIADVLRKEALLRETREAAA